jgi:hypothetical protein
VTLDHGPHVLVHRDNHKLIRDLSLQKEGPYLAGGKRFTKRRRDSHDWEAIDHMTGKTRKVMAEIED